MHSVLVLGAGLVSRPIVRYFLEQSSYSLTVATMFREHADALIDGHERGRSLQLDVNDRAQVVSAIEHADLVVSLVPFHLHAKVAGVALEHGVHLVTTSYVSPEMRALDGRARAAGVLLLNECGLDPGLDHMSAMRLIDGIRARGGEIVSFESCTGGLPAAEAADNPWHYKFSWSPRGALMAGTYAARYLRDGRVVEVPGPELFSTARPYEVDAMGSFECYPNRDSLPYRELYGLRSVRDMQRGTIRYPGWSRAMKGLSDLGLLDTEPRRWPEGATHADLMNTLLPDGEGTLRERAAAELGLDPDDDVLERMEWAGLFDDEPLGAVEAAPLDLVALLFEGKMSYRPGERDMVVMQHRLGVVYPDGRRERHVSQLVAYGHPDGFSATSRTVSLPAAIAADLVLERRLPLHGVHVPTRREIYEPILSALEPRGIAFREWVESESGNP